MSKKIAYLFEKQHLINYALSTLLAENFEVRFSEREDLEKAYLLPIEAAFFLVNLDLLDEKDILHFYSLKTGSLDRTLLYRTHATQTPQPCPKIHSLLGLGAKAIVLEASPVQIKHALQFVENKVHYFCPHIMEILLKGRNEGPKPRRNLLTRREIEILKILAVGLSSKQIADRLNLCTRTVEAHRSNIMKKLKTNNAAQCIQEANRLNLL